MLAEKPEQFYHNHSNSVVAGGVSHGYHYGHSHTDGDKPHIHQDGHIVPIKDNPDGR